MTRRRTGKMGTRSGAAGSFKAPVLASALTRCDNSALELLDRNYSNKAWK